MEGCPGCEQQQKFKNQQLQSKLKEAIAYAKEHQTTVAIYEEPGQGYQFIRYDLAAGLPVIQIVSQYSSVTP
jgi:hypothetical protein